MKNKTDKKEKEFVCCDEETAKCEPCDIEEWKENVKNEDNEKHK